MIKKITLLITVSVVAFLTGCGGGGGGGSAPQPEFTGSRVQGSVEVELTWTAPADANRTGFKIYRQIEGETGYTLVAVLDVSARSHVDVTPAYARYMTVEYLLYSVDTIGSETQVADPVLLISGPPPAPG